jgi:GT2 family glycosyltransferase
MNMKAKDLSICIVNWNTDELLTTCVRSVFETIQNVTVEVIVVDNASNDNSVQRCMAEHASDPRFNLLQLTDNLGFAGGNNRALQLATGRYILLLNPDTLVLPGALDSAVAFLDAYPECGVMGPRLLNRDGSAQPSVGNFPTLSGMFWEATRLRKLFPRIRLFSRFKRIDMDYNQMQVVDQPSGACLFVRRSVVESVGPLDERYFMYYEEVDWCYRIKSAGWTIYYYPSISIIHLGGRSSSQNLDVRIVENALSKLRYFYKNHQDKSGVLLGIRAILAFESLMRMIIVLIRHLSGHSNNSETYALASRYRRVLGAALSRRLS